MSTMPSLQLKQFLPRKLLLSGLHGLESILRQGISKIDEIQHISPTACRSSGPEELSLLPSVVVQGSIYQSVPVDDSRRFACSGNN
jgi:hypothetical protein